MYVYTPREWNLVVSEAYIDSWRTIYHPNYWTYSFKWVPNHRDHGESKHMKNCFSDADFFTGAGIEPETFMVRVRRATAEPPWLSFWIWFTNVSKTFLQRNLELLKWHRNVSGSIRNVVETNLEREWFSSKFFVESIMYVSETFPKLCTNVWILFQKRFWDDWNTFTIFMKSFFRFRTFLRFWNVSVTYLYFKGNVCRFL